MTPSQFMERHRHVEWVGVGLDGNVTNVRCECCGQTPECERYTVTGDGKDKLVCPTCASIIGAVLQPENCDHYLMTDQPPTCPNCGRRVAIVHGGDTDKQVAQCQPCAYVYCLEVDHEEEEKGGEDDN